MKKKIAIICVTAALLLALPGTLLVWGFALPAQYGGTFLGELKHKASLLEEVPGPRIVLVGGSGAAFGVDSALVERELPGYSVVNFGMYAALGTTVMLDLCQPLIQEGDIVILIPEQQEQTLSGWFDPAVMWQGLDGAFELLRSLPRDKLERLAGAFPSFAGQKFSYFLRGEPPQPQGVYCRASFNEWGDVDSPLCTQNVMPGGFDANTPIYFDADMVTDEFAQRVREYARAAEAAGAVLWYAPCPMNGASVEGAEDMDAFYAVLQERLGIPLAGDPHDFMLEAGWFYDTNFHPNSSGKTVYTKALIRAVKAMLGDSSPTDISLPPMPDLAEALSWSGDDGDGPCFTYEERNGVLTATGLTAAGLERETLTVPSTWEGHTVSAIGPRTFAGAKGLRKVTVQPSVKTIADGAFNGCAALERIVVQSDRPSDCRVGQGLLDGTDAAVYVPRAALSAYRTDYFWSVHGGRIQPNESSILPRESGLHEKGGLFMKTKQAFNPYMPSWEYVPDAEPHIVDGRVYVYGSHDLFNGLNFCLGDYVCWSAPVDDLGNWTYHGCIFKREQDPAAPKIRMTNGLAAPDMVVGPDGRYYLYYFMGGTKMISVAVCDEPAGKYEFYGYVKYKDGTPIGKRNEPFQFDPGCLMDEDGRLYLYTGFAFGGNPILLDGSKPTTEGPMWFELDTSDMLTVVSGDELNYLDVLTGEKAKGTPYESQPFGEASSMRKFNGKYYFIYSSLNSHNLCWAVSDKPTGGFTYGGVLVSCGDIGLPGVPDTEHARMCTGNTHGSLIEIGGKYYVFYHRHSNRKQSSRQACAEQIQFEDGKFYQAEMTSCGLNGEPLKGVGHYPAYIACNVYGKSGTRFMSMVKYRKGLNPFLTQKGGDREEGPDQYMSNFCTDCTVGFKYFDLRETKEITVHLQGYGNGCAVTIRKKEKGEVICRIPVETCTTGKDFTGKLPAGLGEKEALYFSVEGKGGTFDFVSFDLK